MYSRPNEVSLAENMAEILQRMCAEYISAERGLDLNNAHTSWRTSVIKHKLCVCQSIIYHYIKHQSTPEWRWEPPKQLQLILTKVWET